jgi:hypothetical protein
MLKQTSFPMGKADVRKKNILIEGFIVTTILFYFASKIYDNYIKSTQNFVNN